MWEGIKFGNIKSKFLQKTSLAIQHELIIVIKRFDQTLRIYWDTYFQKTNNHKK